MLATGKENTQAGFTLLEMLVTLAIAGLIAGIGYPAVARGIERQEFVRAVADIKLALREARSQAIRQDMRTPIARDPDGRLTAAGIVVSPRIPAAVTLVLPKPAPVFFGDGTTMAGDMVLRSRRFEVHLKLDRLTGLIETGA